MKRCLICKKDAETHHIKTRKSGGSDHHTNLMPLCRQHHSEVHQIGLNKFSSKYRNIIEYLLVSGWEFCFTRKKWVNHKTPVCNDTFN